LTSFDSPNPNSPC